MVERGSVFALRIFMLLRGGEGRGGYAGTWGNIKNSGAYVRSESHSTLKETMIIPGRSLLAIINKASKAVL